MKARMLLSMCAFAQRARPGHGALARFQNALTQDGFDVTPGAAGYCGSEPDCMQPGVEGCPSLTIDSRTIRGLISSMCLEPARNAGDPL